MIIDRPKRLDQSNLYIRLGSEVELLVGCLYDISRYSHISNSLSLASSGRLNHSPLRITRPAVPNIGNAAVRCEKNQNLVNWMPWPFVIGSLPEDLIEFKLERNLFSCPNYPA